METPTVVGVHEHSRCERHEGIILTGKDFAEALSRHVRENHKHDPVAARHIESTVSLEWAQRRPLANDASSSSSSGREERRIRGTLSLRGDHVTVALRCERDDVSDDESGERSLRFRIEAHGRLNTLDGSGEEDENVVGATDGRDEKERRTEARVRRKTLERLASDPYVRMLLNARPDDDDATAGRATNLDAPSSRSSSRPLLLCEAVTRSNGAESYDGTGSSTSVGKKEERVHVSYDVLTCIQRAIFPRLECNLSVLEILLRFPWLGVSTSDRSSSTTNRMVLLLLEDAMVDACDVEGEDEMLEDLTISGDGDRGHGGGRQWGTVASKHRGNAAGRAKKKRR